MDRFNEILRMEQIVTDSKETRILDNAKLNLFEGEVAGLVGVNYSGKTTLTGAVTGLFPCTAGKIIYLENPIRITSIEQARKLGIYYIQPVSSLIAGLTVAENILLTPEKNKGILTRRKHTNQKARELLDALGVDISEEAAVETLSHYNRIVVEVCKALLNDARIIIMDNVVSALSQHSLGRFQKLLELLRARNTGILLVEARIKKLTPFCDRLFILREGRTVGVLKREEFDDGKIVSLMIGYALSDDEEAGAEAESPATQKLLELRKVRYRDTLKNISFAIYRNEILGVLNVNKHSGKAIEQLLLGIAQPDGGSILIEGASVRLDGPHDALARGIAVVPEDDLLLPDFSLGDNIVLSAAKTTSRGVLLNMSELRYLKDELISQYMGRDELLNGELIPDGWLYQKKMSFCRALAASPKLMVLSNPTQRIDFLSRQVIFEDILSLKKQRITALVISTSVNELMDVCDRIVVVQNGQVLDTFVVCDEQLEKIRMKYGSYLKDL